jgi:predicted DNA-binding transcriptional regulator YafY
VNRTERLAAILIRLQARSLVRARDLAEEFEVGIRTIYRDMEALLESGVPLRAEAGVGYALERGWRLPPLSLSAEEASALLVACAVAGASESARTRGAMRSGLAKLRAVLPAAERDYLERLDDGVEAFPGSGAPPGDPGVLAALRDALALGRLVRVEYRSAAGKESERDLEPLGLYREPSGWRLLAWCRLRGEYRQFFASRMTAARVLDEGFDRSRHPELGALLANLGSKLPTFVASIRCAADRAGAFREKAYAVLGEKVEAGEAELSLVVGDASWFARATLGAADSLLSVGPPALAEAYASIASDIARRVGRSLRPEARA